MSTSNPPLPGGSLSDQQVAMLSAWLQSDKSYQALSREVSELRATVARLTTRVEQLATKATIPDEHLAIMGAVFAAHFGRRVRIRSVQKTSEVSGWTQAGRVILHAQRHVRRP
jgi:hypothetical protein